jgi:hypothetical protein
MRFATISGEKTNWGLSTPYIPVPYTTKSVGTDAARANSGILICGQASSLTPTRFGIRLKLRINNVGFDYVELKRYNMAKKASVAIPKTTTGKGKNYLPTEKGAGMTEAGRRAYNKANGSNLQAPAPNPKTEKDKGRRKSFCARMGGVKGPTSKDGKLTRKGAALKRWKC